MSTIRYEKHLEIQRTVPHSEAYHTENAENPLPQNTAVDHSMVNTDLEDSEFPILYFISLSEMRSLRSKGPRDSLTNSPEQTIFV